MPRCARVTEDDSVSDSQTISCGVQAMQSSSMLDREARCVEAGHIGYASLKTLEVMLLQQELVRVDYLLCDLREIALHISGSVCEDLRRSIEVVMYFLTT